MAKFTIVHEPRDATYADLLRFLSRHCDRFGLVLRPNIAIEPSGAAFLKRMEPFHIAAFDSRRWPGTELLDDFAHVTHYRLCSESLAILLDCSRALYDWLQPALPEDLFALRPDGSTTLGTIAHEHDAFLELSDDELGELSRACPHMILHSQ